MATRRFHWLAALALVLSACGASGTPVRGQFRVEDPDRGPRASQLPYACQPGFCFVGEEVVIDERDIRGASLVQEGESQALIVLEFTRKGVEKLSLATRSNPGRRMAFVQDGKVLLSMLIEGELQDKAVIRGPEDDLRRIYLLMTAPPAEPKGTTPRP